MAAKKPRASKPAQSTRRSTPVPNWVIDNVLPFLQGDELLLYIYILRTTWGAGRKEARISKNQMIYGTFYEDQRIDAGTGMSEQRVVKALKALLDFGLVEMVAAASWRARLPKRLKPGWGEDVDVSGLRERWMKKRANQRRNYKNFSGENLEGADIPAALIETPGVLAGEGSYEKFVAAFILRDEDEDGGDMPDTIKKQAADEYFGMKMPTSALRDKLNKNVAYASSKGLSVMEFNAIRDRVLEIVGKTFVLDPDLDLDDAEIIIDKAARCATIAIAAGVKVPDQLNGLKRYWEKERWEYSARKAKNQDSALDIDTLLRSVMGDYLAAGKHMQEVADPEDVPVLPPGTRPVQPVVTGEMDDLLAEEELATKPKPKRKRTNSKSPT